MTTQDPAIAKFEAMAIGPVRQAIESLKDNPIVSDEMAADSAIALIDPESKIEGEAREKTLHYLKMLARKLLDSDADRTGVSNELMDKYWDSTGPIQ